jgi:hypothetical protein
LVLDLGEVAGITVEVPVRGCSKVEVVVTSAGGAVLGDAMDWVEVEVEALLDG